MSATRVEILTCPAGGHHFDRVATMGVGHNDAYFRKVLARHAIGHTVLVRVEGFTMTYTPAEIIGHIRSAWASNTDQHGNVLAREGCDRCPCGAKYWENDTCVSCGSPFSQTLGHDRLMELRAVAPYHVANTWPTRLDGWLVIAALRSGSCWEGDPTGHQERAIRLENATEAQVRAMCLEAALELRWTHDGAPAGPIAADRVAFSYDVNGSGALWPAHESMNDFVLGAMSAVEAAR